MKKIYIITCALALSMSSCDKDLLEKQPVTTLNPTTFWQNGAEAEMAVNALYTFLPGMSQVTYDNKTDLSIEPFSGGNSLVNGQIQVTSGEILGWWRSHFRAVAAANRFLEDVALVPANEITPALLDRLKAEARFVRAVNYTFLVNYFGNVPLITSSISPAEASVVSRTAKQEVIDFIEKELTEVAAILPATYTGANIGRITKGAALAWKARAMLWTKQYQKAADAAKAVMDLNSYKLADNYAGLFKYSGEYQNKEVILEYMYTNVTGHNIMQMASPYGITKQTSFLSINPTALLVNDYQTINGRSTGSDPAYNPEDPFRNRDPRLQATIWIPLFKAGSFADVLWGTTVPHDVRPKSKTKDEVAGLIRGNQTGFLMKKYLNQEDIANLTNSSQNYIILRYADVLLMYAESKIELGQIDATVVKAINDVRLRAGIPGLQASGVNTGIQSEMRTAVRHERKIELAMEGWRFYDIRRWDIAHDLMKGSQPVPGLTYRDITTGQLATVNFTGVTWNYQKKNADHTYPIPFDEYNMNPNLLPQNAGW